jgi:uncharacterized repeat protein (TIGR02543 family)
MKIGRTKIPRFGLLAGLLLVGVLTVALAAPALAIEHPIAVYGDVELDDVDAPVGTEIGIYLGGILMDTTAVTTAGEYGPVQIWADESEHGEVFTFTVDGFPAISDPAAPAFGWQNQEVDLAAWSGVTYTLDVAIDPVGGGTVTDGGIDCPGDCTQDYAEDTVVTLTAEANEGFEFVNWTGDATGTNPVVDVTMDDDKMVTANFRVPGEYVLEPGPNTLSTPAYLASTLGDIIPGTYGVQWIGYRLDRGRWVAVNQSTTVTPLVGFVIINQTVDDLELDVDGWPWAAWTPGSSPMLPPTLAVRASQWSLVGPAPGRVDGVAPDMWVDDFMAGVSASRVVSPGWGDQAAWSATYYGLWGWGEHEVNPYKAYFIFPDAAGTMTGSCTVP